LDAARHEVSPHGPWDDSLMFVFDGGILSNEQSAAITVDDGASKIID
jgi:8-oxo-dGTP diphosphatase